MRSVRKVLIELFMAFLFFFLAIGIMIGAYLYQDTWTFVVCGIIVIALWNLWEWRT
jgi:hypothetical protein